MNQLYSSVLSIAILAASSTIAQAETIGSDPTGLEETFAYYKNATGTVRKFPLLSQIEQGKSFQEGGYSYVKDGRRNTVKRELSRACGPLALLMLRNEKYRISSNKNNDTIRNDVRALRAVAGITGDVDTTVYQLGQMARSSLINFQFVAHDEKLNHEATYNNGREFSGAADLSGFWNAISSELANGRSAVVLLKPGSIVPPNLNYRHFVVVFKVRNYASSGAFGSSGYVHYLDPWIGQTQARSKDDFLNSIYLGDRQDYLIIG